ncbi:MAG: HNH endonuclease, partial [Caldilineaceae bacterium]|nr:HNH endonuclease [Caldilineaceae bacterium]
YCSPRGYGQFGWKGKIYTAHRVAWELVNGSIPDGALCCHRCDNRKCCNPAHIFLGTHADNMRDMVNKGRHVSVMGEPNYNTKLTEQDVISIRGEKFVGWRKCDIAQHFGISSGQVGRILSRKSWAHLDATQDAARENERPPAAKLTEQDVIAIRSDLYDGWTLAAIGIQFGITESQASNILNRKSWAHVNARQHESDSIKGKRDLRAKLTAEQVLEIRSDLYSGWMQDEIAQQFGITKSQVSYILRRKSWKHI